jgi:hypothetical protein
MSFASRLKTALVGDPDAQFVYIGNFEVEQQWSIGEVGLPNTSFAPSVVNRMDEIALLLADESDVVLLKSQPDAQYLAYLRGLGLALPTIICGDDPDPGRNVTEDVLASPGVLNALTAIASPDVYLLAHGVSALEEELASRTGLRLATAGAPVCKPVNSKVYSRRLADELGLRQPTGWACETVDELAAAVESARPLVAAGHRVGFKDAYGVSGKGIIVVEDERRLDQVRRMVTALAKRRDDGRIGVVLEEWVAKRADLGYQFTVGRDGSVRFASVGEALVTRGVYQASRLPARLSAAQLDEVQATAELIGARLAKDGYHGVVGVDAMIDPDEGLYPVNEINARNTMLTYLASLSDRLLAGGGCALARQYPLRLAAPLTFDGLCSALDGLLLGPEGTGVVVNTFATVNADANSDGASFAGKLYALVAAATPDQLEALDAEVTVRLAALAEGTKP